ncbi:MAG: tetratricopeptide repeat protein [Candidatus Eisenbacteria bacterium]
MSGTGSRSHATSSRRTTASRIVLTLSPLAVTLLLGGCLGPPARSGSDVRTVRIVEHQIGAGETMASIADDFYGDASAESYLRDTNDIPEDVTPAEGDVIEVPVGEPDIERYGRRTLAKTHYNRGTLFAAQGALTRAAEEFRAALRVDPRFADAGYNLGVVLLRSGEATRAVAILRQTVAVRPSDPSLQYALGSALVSSGDHDGAVEVFDTVLSLSPRHEDALFSRAIALVELGRVADAVFQLDAYVRGFPGGTWVDEAAATLKELGEGAGSGD